MPNLPGPLLLSYDSTWYKQQRNFLKSTTWKFFSQSPPKEYALILDRLPKNPFLSHIQQRLTEGGIDFLHANDDNTKND